MVYTDSTEVPWWCAGDRDCGYELFVYYGIGWRVTLAKRLLKTVPHPITELVVATVADMSHHEVLVWEDKVQFADLSIPVIVVEYNNTTIPIDGWHRIARALREGITVLPAVCLSATESEGIQHASSV